MKQMLKFKKLITIGRTKRFEVSSNHSGEILGFIHWLNSWRCYVMEYITGTGNIYMSLSCEKEIVKFLEELQKEKSK